MKKLISSVLVLLLLSSSLFIAVPALAEDEAADSAAPEFSVVDFTTTFADKANWNTAEQEVTFTNDTMTFKKVNDNIIGYHGQAFENEILEFKMTMDLESEGWPGITIRSENDENVMWGGNVGYIFVFQGEFIELQRWNSANDFLVCLPKTPALKNGENTIQIGAINTPAGVNIILNANGKPVINYLDNHRLAITKPGYVTFYNNTSLKLSKLTAEEKAAMPPVALNAAVTGEAKVGSTLTGSYDYADFGGQQEKDSIIQWYRSDEPLGKADESETALNAIAKYPGYVPPGIFDKIEGANSLEYTLTEEDADKYLILTVTPVNAKGVAGAEARSSIQFVDTMPEKLDKSIIMMIDYNYAWANDLLQEIDPDNWDVVPTIVDSRTLLPVRFIAESLGAEVGWTEATREVTIKMEGYDVKMTLDVPTMTVNGADVALDVAPQVFPETGRTMLPVRAVAEAVGKHIVWDPDNQLVLICDEEGLFDLERDATQLKNIADKMLNDEF